MKTPRRDFVVEYKTNRHHTKARSTSIWGNLDLQAVARAVEADGATPEADLSQVPSILEDVAAVEPEAITSSDAQLEADGPLGNRITKSAPNDPAIDPAVVEHNAFDAPFSQEQPTSAPVRLPKSGMKSRARRQPADVSERPGMLDHDAQYDPDEELAALEAENRQLKRLMLVKLRQENDKLKSMLRRSDSGLRLLS